MITGSVVGLDDSRRQRRTIVEKLHDQDSMRAMLRRNDPRPFGDDLPRRGHELVGPVDGNRHAVGNFTQSDRIEVGVGLTPEVEARVEGAVAYADQRIAGKNLVQLELELRMALEGERKQLAHLQYGRVQHRADLDRACRPATETLRSMAELLHRLDDALRVLQQQPPRGRERHAR